MPDRTAPCLFCRHFVCELFCGEVNALSTLRCGLDDRWVLTALSGHGCTEAILRENLAAHRDCPDWKTCEGRTHSG